MMHKLTLALLFAFALTATAAYAQAPATAGTQQARPSQEKTLEQRAEDITASMAKNLRLSPEQVKKVRAINLASVTQAEEAKLKHKADPKAFAYQMEIISQTRISQIKDALTEQQFSQYQYRREDKMGVPKEAKSNPASRQMDQGYQY